MIRATIIIAVLCSLAWSQDTPRTPGVYDEATARQRLRDAISHAPNDPDRAADLLAALADRAPTGTIKHLAMFNLGVLELERANHDAAAAALGRACAAAPDDRSLRDARFNLGHAHHASIGAEPDGALDADAIATRIAKLEHAEHAFLGAARLDPSFEEAVRNLERVRRRIAALEQRREALERQQPQQNQDQPGQEGGEGDRNDQPPSTSDELQRLADEQREQAQRNEQSPDPTQDEREERRRAQDELSERTEQAAQQARDDAATREAIDEARKAQRRAQRALEDGDTERAAREQQAAADALDRAAERARENQAHPRDGEQGSRGENPEPPDAAPQDKINPLARELLEREQRQRERRREFREGGRPVRVEEDW